MIKNSFATLWLPRLDSCRRGVRHSQWQRHSATTLPYRHSSYTRYTHSHYNRQSSHFFVVIKRRTIDPHTIISYGGNVLSFGVHFCVYDTWKHYIYDTWLYCFSVQLRNYCTPIQSKLIINLTRIEGQMWIESHCQGSINGNFEKFEWSSWRWTTKLVNRVAFDTPSCVHSLFHSFPHQYTLNTGLYWLRKALIMAGTMNEPTQGARTNTIRCWGW